MKSNAEQPGLQQLFLPSDCKISTLSSVQASSSVIIVTVTTLFYLLWGLVTPSSRSKLSLEGQLQRNRQHSIVVPVIIVTVSNAYRDGSAGNGH